MLSGGAERPFKRTPTTRRPARARARDERATTRATLRKGNRPRPERSEAPRASAAGLERSGTNRPCVLGSAEESGRAERRDAGGRDAA